MDDSSAAQTVIRDSDRLSFGPIIIFSLTFHLFCFFVLPLATRIIWRTKKFERPQTFQLVQPPVIAPPATTPVEAPPQPQKIPQQSAPKPKAAPKPKPKPAEKPVPAEKKTAPKEDQQELDELSDLLQSLPSPARARSLQSEFTYHWYINSVQSKIEQYWNPPLGDKSMSSVVRFTIESDGSVSGLTLVSSSASGSHDNLALRAVKLAQPFGKLPAQWTSGRLDMQVTLRPVKQ
jgi:protein TonB